MWVVGCKLLVVWGFSLRVVVCEPEDRCSLATMEDALVWVEALTPLVG